MKEQNNITEIAAAYLREPSDELLKEIDTFLKAEKAKISRWRSIPSEGGKPTDYCSDSEFARRRSIHEWNMMVELGLISRECRRQLIIFLEIDALALKGKGNQIPWGGIWQAPSH